MDVLSRTFSYNAVFLLVRSYNPDPNTKNKYHSSIVQKFHSFGTTALRDFGTFLCFVLGSVWALPLSLAATEGISLDFFSSGY